MVKHEERETLFEEYVSELKAAEMEAEQSLKAKSDEQVCCSSISITISELLFYPI